jgi:hypothetical protein
MMINTLINDSTLVLISHDQMPSCPSALRVKLPRLQETTTDTVDITVLTGHHTRGWNFKIAQEVISPQNQTKSKLLIFLEG